MMEYIYGNNIFLTGGSSGIGLAAAELLAANGYTVYAASRAPSGDIRSFPGGGAIHPVAMDVRSLSSAEIAVNSVLSNADIGVVVHCAGIGIACAAEDFPQDAIAGLMDTNFTGVMRVNSLVLPHLRKRGSGLCLIIGSVAGIFPVPFQSHYSASKAALDSYAAALRMELHEYGVRVCLVMPGDTNTGFTSARKYFIAETSPFYDACVKAVGKMENDELGGRPPVSVAKTILKIVSRIKPPARIIVGFDYKLLAFLKRFLPDRLIEYILRKMYIGR